MNNNRKFNIILTVKNIEKRRKNALFETLMLNTASVQNFVEDGKVAGVKFRVIEANYRGEFLSLHNGYLVDIDGEIFLRDSQKFEVNGKPPRTFEELKNTALWEMWEFGEEATLYVYKEGGLTPGKHRIGILESILGAYGRTPMDEEYVRNPPDPAPHIGDIGGSKNRDILYFDIDFKG